MINKIVRKSMRKKRGLIIAISILIIISSLFVGLSHFVYDKMEENYLQLQNEANVEDFRLYTLPVSDEEFEQIYTDDLISRLESKFAMNLEEQEIATYRPEDSDERAYGITKYNPDDEIDTIILEAGSLPEKSDEILVQPQALIQAGLAIGDTTSIDGTDYQVSGTGYLTTEIMPADFAGNMLYPNFDKYMPVVMSAQAFENLNADSNDLTFSTVYKGKFDKTMKLQKRQNKYSAIIDEASFEMPVLDDSGNPQFTERGQLVTQEVNGFLAALDRTMNPNISSVENEVNGSRTTFIFLAGILSVLTIFLATILINSVFKAQRREMGIMKAEGVSIGKLGLGFAFYIFLLITISAVIGAGLSTFAANGMRGMYEEIFMLKDYDITSNVITNVVVDLSVIAIAMLIIIYFVSIRRNLNTPTLHLIKNISSEKAPKHNVGKYFKRLSFVRKYQLNLVLRNLSKTVLLGFAVYVSSFLLLLGVLMYTSVHNMTDNMYGENFKFNYVVMFSENNIMNEDEVENPMISQAVPLLKVPDDVELDEPLEDGDKITIEAYDFDESTVVNLEDVNGEKLTNENEGLIASSGFLKEYNLEVGDELVVENPYDVGEKLKLTIVNETDDFFLPYCYMPLDYYQEVFGIRDDMINGYQSTGDLTNAVKKDILNQDPGAFVYEAADMEQMMGDSLQMLNVAIVIIGVLAAIIAFVALYAISSVIIESNSKTISVMKVLGYSSREVRTMTIGIYKWLVIGIYLVSIPLLQWMIQTTVNTAMADMDFVIQINLNYVYSLLGLVVILVVYLIASKLTYRKIEKIKLAESLKADE